MSEETKTNEPVKQEGDFKIKSKPKVKKFSDKKDEPIKVDLTKDVNVKIEEPIKVDLTKKPEQDAIQVGETKKVDVGEQTGEARSWTLEETNQLKSPARLLKKFKRWEKSHYQNKNK